MGSLASMDDEREGAEVVYGAEACRKHSAELLEELGFPKGVLPLKNLEECGRVRSTGLVWMKQKKACDHYFEGTKTLVSYATEVTAYVDKNKMKRMGGVKSRQMMVWVPITEMSIEDPTSRKIFFKTPMGFGRSFHFSAFEEVEEEKEKEKEEQA